MADFTSINIMKAVIVITDPKVDQMIVDYDDNTQKMGTTFTYKAKITGRHHG